MAVAEQRLTLEEFLALPEQEPALEFEDGVVTQKVSPTTPHGLTQKEIVFQVESQTRKPRTAYPITELRLTLAGKSYVPDVSVYRAERLARGSDGRPLAYQPEVPDVAWEIVSPGQRVLALVARCLLYVAHGVPIVILLDPIERTVLRFADGGRVRALTTGEVLEFGPVLPGCRIAVDDLFGALEPE